MKIRLNCQDLTQFQGEPVVPPPDTQIKRAMQAFVNALGQHPEVKEVSPLLQREESPEVAFPDPDSEIRIDVLLTSDPVAIERIGLDTAKVSLFLVSKDLKSRVNYPDAFRVVVRCDEQAFLDYVKSERDMETNPTWAQYDNEYLSSYLATISREVAQAVEFISHGNGLTPNGVLCLDEMFHDKGDIFDYSIHDIANGAFIREDMKSHEFTDRRHADEVMAERVNETGRRWLADTLCNDVPLTKSFTDEFARCLSLMESAMEARFECQPRLPAPTPA